MTTHAKADKLLPVMVSGYSNVTCDGTTDYPVAYRDCSKITSEKKRASIGSADVECDGELERVHISGDRDENKTTLFVYNGKGELLRVTQFDGYPVGPIVITPEEVLFNLDTNGDGVADKEYGHECGILKLPYIPPGEESEEKKSVRI